MSNLPRRALVSRKRKEWDGLVDAVKTTSPTKDAEAEPMGSSNRLLAGYLAHEFLTRGTLFGERLDPDPDSDRSGSTPTTSSTGADLSSPVMKHRCYAEVARLLKADGSHLPDVVNPTQLARLLER